MKNGKKQKRTELKQTPSGNRNSCYDSFDNLECIDLNLGGENSGNVLQDFTFSNGGSIYATHDPTSDYDDEDWKRIEDTAEKNGWSPPKPDLDLNILKKNNFFDALAMAEYPPDRPWRTASTDNPMYRIDYCDK